MRLVKWKLIKKEVIVAQFKILFLHLHIFGEEKLQLAHLAIILAGS